MSTCLHPTCSNRNRLTNNQLVDKEESHARNFETKSLKTRSEVRSTRMSIVASKQNSRQSSPGRSMQGWIILYLTTCSMALMVVYSTLGMLLSAEQQHFDPSHDKQDNQTFSWSSIITFERPKLPLLSPATSSSSILQNTLTAFLNQARPNRIFEMHLTAPDYVDGMIPSPCVHVMADDQHRCGYYIHRRFLRRLDMQASNRFNKSIGEPSWLMHIATLPLNHPWKRWVVEAALDISKEFPLTCGQCRPPSLTSPDDKDSVDTRQSSRTRYWRYDRAGPILSTTAQSVTTIDFLDSIPTQHRLPQAALQNLTQYLSDNANIYPQRDYFFLYNPSIVPLPLVSHHHEHDKSNRGNDDHDRDSPSSYYLASFRVSNQQACFHPLDRQRMQGFSLSSPFSSSSFSFQQRFKARNLVGLAILDAANLQVLQNVVIDLQAAGMGSNAEDIRLFVLPSIFWRRNNQQQTQTRQQEERHLFIGSNDVLTPLWLTGPKPLNPHGGMRMENARSVPIVFAQNKTSNNNNNNNERTMWKVWIGPTLSCAPCGRKRLCGKNLNYFAVTTANDGHGTTRSSIWAEIWPSQPHVVRQIDIDRSCQRSAEPVSYTTDESDGMALPSFATVEELEYATLNRTESILTRGRGGACCIELMHRKDGQQQRLLVGIQHSKTPSQSSRIAQLPANQTGNHYVSRLYAFESFPPFRIIALSGWFCLGFPPRLGSRDNGLNFSPFSLVDLTRWRTLQMGETTFPSCPRIHFVSGMVIAIDDAETVLVSYGINDCVTQFVRIPLDEFRRLLFANTQQ